MSERSREERAMGTAGEPSLDAELARGLRATPGAPDLEALLSVVEREQAAERGVAAYLRSRSTALRAWLASGAAAALIGLAWAWFARPDLAAYPGGRMAAVVLIALAALGAGLALALRPTQRAAAAHWAAPLTAGLGVIGLLVVYLMPEVPAIDPAHVQAPGLGAVLMRALPCLGIGAVVAAALYAVWGLVDRGGVRRGLAAAAAAGVTANLVLQLHCPVTAPAHLLVGHLGVALLMIAAALAARK